MKCDKCGNDFPENEIDSSHDYPCYLFEGITRKERKQRADKFGRHWLCKKCHKDYDNLLIKYFKSIVQKIKEEFFNG